MIDELNVNAFEQFGKNWALVTAGSLNNYNTMTIGWGGVGTLWSLPVVTVYVKPIRYTWNFLNDNEYFTVTFLPEENRNDLLLLGTKSGRDGDKVAETSLQPIECDHDTVSFKQATVTLVCKKIYWQDMKSDTLPQNIIDKYYQSEEPHRMYVGEVVRVIKK